MQCPRIQQEEGQVLSAEEATRRQKAVTIHFFVQRQSLDAFASPFHSSTHGADHNCVLVGYTPHGARIYEAPQKAFRSTAFVTFRHF
eukprot:16184-Heterococcus_DN1.PRE.2